MTGCLWRIAILRCGWVGAEKGVGEREPVDGKVVAEGKKRVALVVLSRESKEWKRGAITPYDNQTKYRNVLDYALCNRRVFHTLP
jgi:hypothetical protein